MASLEPPTLSPTHSKRLVTGPRRHVQGLKRLRLQNERARLSVARETLDPMTAASPRTTSFDQQFPDRLSVVGPGWHPLLMRLHEQLLALEPETTESRNSPHASAD